MNQNYEPEFKKKIVRLHLEEGRTLRGLAEEYGISKASISIWTKQFREECQENEEAQAEYDYMKENCKLKKQLAELQKENDFLKKAAAFFAKEIEKRIIGSASVNSKIQFVRFITHMAGLTAIVPFTFTLAGEAIQSAG